MSETTKTYFSYSLLLLSAAVLALGATRGFYAWDYFSLWGTQAKSVWATGNFWFSGADTPLNFTYESIVAAIVGLLVHVISPGKYWDPALGVFNVVVIFGLCFGVLRFAVRPARLKMASVLSLALLLLLISPGSWGQLTLGGYADFAGALTLTIFALAINRGRTGVAFWSLIATIFIKPIFWIWLAIALIAFFLKTFLESRTHWKSNILICLGLAASVVAVVLWERHLFRGEVHDIPALKIAVDTSKWSAERIFRFLYLCLKNHNALSLGCLLFSLVIWSREKFWFIFYLGGLGYLFLVYFVLFAGVSSTEEFASLSRYFLPLLLPLVFRFLAQPAWVAYLDQSKRSELVIRFILLGLIVARGGEELVRFRDGKETLAKRTNLCLAYPESCARAEELRSQVEAGCKSYILPQSAVPSLPEMIVAYQMLPQRVYFENSRVPPSLQPPCRLR